MKTVFSSQNVFMGCVQFSEQGLNIPLHNINYLVFITKTGCVITRYELYVYT
jgi:hypothetical protein